MYFRHQHRAGLAPLAGFKRHRRKAPGHPSRIGPNRIGGDAVCKSLSFGDYSVEHKSEAVSSFGQTAATRSVFDLGHASARIDNFGEFSKPVVPELKMP